MPEANENHHIQITSRRGVILIEGPDKDWVSKEARWAIEQLPEVSGRIGFDIAQPGDTTQAELSYQPSLWETYR